MLLFGTHEELLVVALAFNLRFVAKGWLLDQRVIHLASCLQDSSSNRVVAVFDLIDCALLDSEPHLLFLCFGVSLALRARKSKSICNDNEPEAELVTEIEQVVCLGPAPVSVDRETTRLEVNCLDRFVIFFVGVPNDLDFTIEARKWIGFLTLLGLGPVAKG